MSTTLAESNARERRLARFAWGVLAYNFLVIAWGAFVRATGSGAGCGKHWPLCNGEVVPTPKSVATLIEASHRVTSGLALVAVVLLYVMCRRGLAPAHPARRSAGYSVVFIVLEALIGAGLVLFELVAHDASMKRALSMVLHLGNTFFLMGALALTAYWIVRRSAESAEAAELKPIRAPRARGPADGMIRVALFASLGGMLLLASSGAIAALGDTLFPARSLRDGLAADLSPLAHAFVRLRLLHPMIALMVGVLVTSTAAFVRFFRPTPRVRAFSRALTLAFLAQFCAGLVNVFLLAPVAMQLVHLVLADVVWIALVLFAWETLEGEGATVTALEAAPDAASDQAPIMSRNGPAPSSAVPPSTTSVDPVT